ncbi:MAG: hypothetical protein JXM72_00830 [Deltaproteobacteria bacterium]|nr:hypothetical protein [Deltaproteobacteria bacterium]
MEAEKIRQAIIHKAEQEAASIIGDAQGKASELIDKAIRSRDSRFEEMKDRIITQARQESEKILAKGTVDARVEILKQKDILLEEIISRVRKELLKNATNPQTLNALINETLAVLEDSEEICFYVAQKDIRTTQDIVSKDTRLKKQVREIKEFECLGGVLAEDAQGKVSIDNTYDTRLEMLLSKILPVIGNKLFGDTAS